MFKAPICFAISFGLGIVLHKVFLSEIFICSFHNNQLRNVPVAKLFISCTGQCPVFCNNSLKTPGSFGPFSSCSDEVSRYSKVLARRVSSRPMGAHFWKKHKENSPNLSYVYGKA